MQRRKEKPSSSELRYVINGQSVEFSSQRPFTAFIMGDIHFPFENPAALSLARQIYNDAKPHVTILNGDILDFFGISKYPVPPVRRVMFGNEIKEGAAKLKELRKWGKGHWIYIEGNHEHRLRLYLYRRAPELAGIISVPDLIGCDKLDMRYLAHCDTPVSREEFSAPQVKLGKLYVFHGDTVKLWGNTVNVARSLFLRLLKPALIGHWHRCDSYLQTDYEGVANGAWVTACLAHPRPHYDTGRVWGQGCAVVTIQDGYFEVDNISFISKDKRLFALWRGHRYEVPLNGKG